MGVKSLALSATPSSVNEGITSQLAGSAVMDDDSVTQLTGADIAWSLVSGQVASIDAAGLATTAEVYASGNATVGGNWLGASNTTTLLVLNSNPDNYGTYAGDTIDDAWQVQYFGINNPKAGPNVDADGTGQTNLFKYVAGLNPIDQTARFAVSIQDVPGQPGQMRVVFSPVVSDRTYTVVTKSSLNDPNWAPLASSAQSDSGQQRTVTDLGFSGAKKFYRVSVSKP